MRWSESELVVGLRWAWEEVPVLLDLPEAVNLRWGHVSDLEGGIPLRLDCGSVRLSSSGTDPDGARALIELRGTFR